MNYKYLILVFAIVGIIGIASAEQRFTTAKP